MSKRDEFIENAKDMLDNLNTEADELEEKIQQAQGDTKAKYEEQMAAMRQHRQASQDYINSLKQAGEDKWQELTNQAEHTWKVFQDSVNYFKSRL
ncbi:MAG: hypothetical protein V2J55_03005 [Candidatus Competibacteraceae bacterium]|jgi:chromosome segregation ATPase|nr:hypothetical protein [Candidatus Competibacteraceae bacterium]